MMDAYETTWNAADWVILSVLLLSVLIGLMRGLVVEIMSIAVWLAAIALSLWFGGYVAAWFIDSLSFSPLRFALGYGLVFFGTLLAGAVVVHLLRKLVRSTGLSGTDRLLGMVFGALRGLALVMVLVVLAGLTPLPQAPWWKHSTTIPWFQGLAVSTKRYLPASMRRYLDFDQQRTQDSPQAPGAAAASVRGTPPGR